MGAAGWQEPTGPGRQRIGVTQAAQGIDQPGETRPPKPSQASVLQSADDRLIDTAQKFELPLRNPKPLATTAHLPSDQREPVPRARISFNDGERSPGHRPTMTGGPHPALCGRSRSRSLSTAVMHVGCIAGPCDDPWPPPNSQTRSARRLQQGPRTRRSQGEGPGGRAETRSRTPGGPRRQGRPDAFELHQCRIALRRARSAAPRSAPRATAA